ncbi:response regulator transcription factor [Abyssisolibacter fermentans]|uniref:response regulator transcription factor n=1 Tax=Abyssisolibacter fermentans TaxID=1766203 RepID=UPI000832E8A1|nr:response regulator transcription factor [Abyssisolibacter fermentans]
MNKKILIVEDDVEISNMVKKYLTKEGFDVKTAFDGESALKVFSEDSFDIILLDLMLPKINGMDFMRVIREKSLIPILIMSAKDSDVDKALGLGLGADDYIAKPFSMIELLARIKATIRRATVYSKEKSKGDNDKIIIGDLEVDIDNFSVNKHGKKVELTFKEFEILKLFIKNPNRVFTKALIYNTIWQDNYYGDDNIINVHMRRLREKIEDNPSKPKYIKTLWGIGYKLGEV